MQSGLLLPVSKLPTTAHMRRYVLLPTCAAPFGYLCASVPLDACTHSRVYSPKRLPASGRYPPDQGPYKALAVPPAILSKGLGSGALPVRPGRRAGAQGKAEGGAG